MSYTCILHQGLRCLMATTLVISPLPLMANDKANTDQAKIASCVACHGADGVGKADQYPNLKGQKVAYTVKQLQDFKSGARKNATMNTVARPLSEADMQMLAKFFSQVK